MNIRYLNPLGFVTAVILLLSCASYDARDTHEVQFIVTGNTYPASPFSGYPEKLEFAFGAMSRENAALVIHTGNTIQGGGPEQGIAEQDIVRQLRKFIEQRKTLNAVMHVLIGERDLYRGSHDLFRRYIGHPPYYSFNFGSAHIVILYLPSQHYRLDPTQMRWLCRDLERHRQSPAIFVFTHFPVLTAPSVGVRHPDGEQLHDLFVRYPVKAVISGSLKNLHDFEKDGIRYINAGCFGFNYEDWHWNFNQFYVIRYDGTHVFVKGVKVNFPPNTYKPKLYKDEPEKK